MFSRTILLIAFFYVLIGTSCQKKHRAYYDSTSLYSESSLKKNHQAYIDSIKLHPDTIKARFYFDTAMKLRKQKNYDASNQYFDTAGYLGYNNPAELFYQKGNNGFDQKDYIVAILNYNSAIGDNPKDSRFWHDRALTLYYLGQNSKVICAEVDSALALGDTSNIALLCKEAEANDLKCRTTKQER